MKCAIASCEREATKEIVFTITIPGTPNEPVPVCEEHSTGFVVVRPLARG